MVQYPCCALDHSGMRIWCRNRPNRGFQTRSCTEEAMTKSSQAMENMCLVTRVHWVAYEKLTLHTCTTFFFSQILLFAFQTI